MGIVGFALRFRHTFYVLALMMLFLGPRRIIASDCSTLLSGRATCCPPSIS